jgi:hypothetical protein
MRYFSGNPTVAAMASAPRYYERDALRSVKTPYSTAANRYTLVFPGSLAVNVGGKGLMDSARELSLAAAANWAELTPVDGTVAANRAGKDVYLYACDQGSIVPKLLFSFNSTIPTGYTALNSRKIGGFHCLCVSVGTISGHALTGFVAGDILPASVWDLNFRPACSPEGMVYSSACNKWVDIYLASGTGATTASVNGGTISDTRTWNDFVDDGAAAGKRLLDDGEFQAIAAGSNEQTNIAGSADPVTTGGHVDTASRRMVSHIGCEDCCGVMWQWLRDQSFRCDPDGTVSAAGKTWTVYHAAAPGGNPIYLRQSSDGQFYLASNMATATADKQIGSTDYKIPVKHEVGAATGAIGQVYYDHDAANAYERLLCNIATIAKNVFLPTNNPTFFLEIKHDANAAVTGVALNYDDGADNRLETIVPSAANITTNDLVLNSQAFGWKTIGGNKGQVNTQGTYGDVKLLAGASWSSSSSSGSRSRYASYSRWYATSYFGGRFRAEHRER